MCFSLGVCVCMHDACNCLFTLFVSVYICMDVCICEFSIHLVIRITPAGSSNNVSSAMEKNFC